MRKCSLCKKTQPLANFWKRPEGNGYRSRCRTCLGAKSSRKYLRTEGIQLSDVEAAWLAGIFDGEGSIGVYYHHTGSETKLPRLQVPSTSKDIIAKVQSLTHIKCGYLRLSKKKNHSDSILWMVSRHSDIQPILEQILPYLTEKREQANLVLEYLKIHPFYGQGTSHREEQIINRLKVLNKRGRSQTER